MNTNISTILGISASLSQAEQDILHEVDELSLDYTSLSAESLSIVSPKCVVIGYGELCDAFLALCVDTKHSVSLELSHLLPQDFVSLKGQLGAFELSYRDVDNKIAKLECAQVVSFAKLERLAHFKGVHVASDYTSAKSMLEALLSLIGEYHYTQNIIFSPTHCQYQQRRALSDTSVACHKCVDICPSLALRSGYSLESSLDSSLARIELSSIDCIKCGKCVSVCPTSSLQKEGDTLESITQKARLYKGLIPLIVAKDALYTQEFAMDFKALKAQNAKLLPLPLQVPDMLNSTYLLTLLQESGSQVAIYKPLGAHVDSDIASLNSIYQSIFGTQAIVICKNKEALSDVSNLSHIESSHYIYTPRDNENSKEIFSERMRFWVKQNDYGKVDIKNFGSVLINSSKCTLCYSCVEACNTKALISNDSKFELLFKPSLCTDCGYCVASCAEEGAISLESSTLALNEQSFAYSIKAQDEPFRCVECDKIFATNKSIQKVKHILAPAFKNDSKRLRTLECCADCKVRVMFAN